MATDVGTGLTLTLGSSTWTAEILDARLSGAYTREAIDTTHMGTTVARSFIVSDLYDGGELQLDYHVDLSAAALYPPVTAAAEVWTLTLDDDTVSFTGFITSADMGWLMENKNEGSITVKVAGAITHTVVP